MYRIIGGDQKQYGPVTTEQIRQWVTEGRANASTLVQAEGTTDWKPLGMFPEFADLTPVRPPVAVPPPSGSVPTYLVPAIITTLCCCLPVGVVAIVYAAQVNSKLTAGDLAGATEASNKAKLWTWIAFGAGILANVISGLVYYFMGSSMPIFPR
jgi:hypothetical protein